MFCNDYLFYAYLFPGKTTYHCLKKIPLVENASEKYVSNKTSGPVESCVLYADVAIKSYAISL